MFNVRLARGHLYGKQLFTWLSLVESLVASFVLSCFPLDVLGEIWDLIESVSEAFLTYSCLRLGLSWFIWWVSFAPEFQCCYLYGNLYGKLLFTWLSLVMSMMVSICAVLFGTRCLG